MDYEAYQSPITTIYHKVICSFYNIKEPIAFERLKSLLFEGKINPLIYIDSTQNKPNTPYTNLSTKQIVLNEQYLGFLWCIVSISLTLPERIYAHKRQIPNYFDLAEFEDLDEIDVICA